MNYLKSLNEQQLEAVKHIDGPCLVVAGAGSGKTRVLTCRIAELINNNIPSYNILAITFTNKAAREMKERVNSLIGETKSFIGTFHSFGLKIIRENVEVFNLSKSFSIIDGDDSLSLVKRIIKDKNLDSKKFNAKNIKNKISSLKSTILTKKELEQSMNTDIDKITLSIYKKYEDILKQSNALDFDDLILKPLKEFMGNKELLEKYQDHFPYILVDEFQDTNSIQYMFVKLLSEKYSNIFVVGDANQSIYGFRQSDYKNISYFEKDYKNVKIIKLEQNYRSTQTILNAANDVIKNNGGIILDLKSSREQGNKIKYLRGYDEFHEIKLVVDEIKKLKSKYQYYKNFAILYRTNAQSRSIEQTLINCKIPYKIYGGFSYLERKEIKDLLAYLKLINNLNDEISLRRIINIPKRGIGEKAIQNLIKKSIDDGTSIFGSLSSKKELEFKKIILDLKEFSEKNTLTKLVDYVLEKTDIKKSYEMDNTLESDIRLENLYEFKSLTLSYENKNETITLEEFLNDISLMTNNDETKENKDGVSLMTLHNAKGLEFKVVFLVGMEENIFPLETSIKDVEELLEERRLCYVGMTRAEDELYLTNSRRRILYGREMYNDSSRFIHEINPKYVENRFASSLHEPVDYNSYYYSKDIEYKINDKIIHDTLGEGIIVDVREDYISVAFSSGVKLLNKKHKSITKL